MPSIADMPEALVAAPRYLPVRGWVRLPPGAALADHAAWLSRDAGGMSETCAMLRLDDPLASGGTASAHDVSFALVVIDPRPHGACVDDEGYRRAGRYLLSIGTVASDGNVGIGQAAFALTD